MQIGLATCLLMYFFMYECACMNFHVLYRIHILMTKSGEICLSEFCIYLWQASSSVANIDEWKWKLSLLLRNEQEQEILSRDKRDRRDYEQISNLAKRMGLYWYGTHYLKTSCSFVMCRY